MGLKHKRSGLIVLLDYRKKRFKLLYVFLLLIMVMVLLITVFPPLWLLLSSFKTAVELYRVPFSFFPDQLDLNKVVDVWRSLSFGQYYINSIIVVAGAVLASVFFNGLLAYVIAVIKPAGHKIVFMMVMISLMIPPILNMGTLLHNISRLNLINSFVPLWLVFGANPFFFIIFKTYFERLPRSLFEAAMIDGANQMQIFIRVLIPLSKPIIGVVAIFTLNAAWSDFLLPFLVLMEDSSQTVMVKIYKLHADMGTAIGFGPDRMLMVLAMSMIPPILLFFVFQKQITSAVATTGMRD